MLVIKSVRHWLWSAERSPRADLRGEAQRVVEHLHASLRAPWVAFPGASSPHPLDTPEL